MKAEEDRRIHGDGDAPVCRRDRVEGGEGGKKTLIENGKERDRALKRSDKHES